MSLGSDGSATLSGSSRSEEEYTFDQVSEEEEKSSAETTDSWYNDSAEGPAETSATQTNWHLLESERYEKTTDHYEAELSSDASLGSGSPPTLTGSDEGYTDTETFDKFCHTWDTYGTTGGPDCNQSTSTNHEDWPSMVDELLAMMEEEAAMEAGVDTVAEEGGETVPCATCSEAGEEGESEAAGGIAPERWQSAFELELMDIYGYDVRPGGRDEFGLPTGIGSWRPSGFFGYSGISPADTSYGCGGLMCMRVGLKPNYPQQLAQVNGAMAFPTLAAAQKYLADDLNGQGLIVAAEKSALFRTRSGASLEGNFAHPASDVDFFSATNYRTLLGTRDNWYWEHASGPWTAGHRGRVLHNRNGFPNAVIFFVIPNAASESPVIPAVP